MKKIRVLIADDSPTAVQVLDSILSKDPDIEVVGRAVNGQDVIRQANALKPDLITMDIHMPVMNGLEAIRQIMAYRPTPILVVTSQADANTAFRSLSMGALDVMDKPRLDRPDQKKYDELTRKVKLLAQVSVVTHVSGRHPVSENATRTISLHKVVGLVASTGGPRALAEILGDVPPSIGAAFLVVQHISEGFENGLIEWLNQVSSLDVKAAEHGEAIETATVYVAPTGTHLEIDQGHRIVLSDRAPYLGQRPSGNLLFHSLARHAGQRAVGVVLTGMGNDGAEGLKAIRDQGGQTVAQDEHTSLIYGMPKAAVDLGATQRILPIDQMANELMIMCNQGTGVVRL